MNDTTTVLTGHTKKYQVPLSHLEHRYIQQCTDGFELERIYKELISGQEGHYPILEQLTLDRIQNVLPDSQLLRQNKIQIDKSILNVPSVSVINNLPKSNEDWNKIKDNVSREFNNDHEENTSDDDDDDDRSNKRLHLSEQHRLNADTAFKLNNYQQSVELYTKSILLEKNLFAYINRAIAYYKLNNFKASIQDCCHLLSIDSKNIDALTCRARCYLAKQQYDEAKRDLDQLLTIDSENNEAQDLMNTLLNFQKTKEIDIQPSTIITLNIKEDEGNNSMNINTPQRENHLPNPDSPSSFENSSSNDDDDGMVLGDEAGVRFVGNVSDGEGHASRSINVSPTIDDDSNARELINQKPLDQNSSFQINDNDNDLYDNHNYSSYNKNTIRNNNENSSINDAISNSNFGSIIQGWLRDLIALQPNRYFYDRPWSRSSRPWSLDKIQRDIEKFNRFNDYRNAIEVSKKMLQNGVLDYHYYAEYITETLIICAQCYLKLHDCLHAVQYASEALQYNKTDGNTLMYRAKAFENEKFFLFSYADYARVPATNFNYHLTQHTCEKLTKELNSIEGETWREKLPNDKNDDERFLNYLKQKTNYSEDNSYEWYETNAEQLSLDACYILAIRCYTYCIELQPHITNNYLKRAACYLKVFEPQKVIDDCDVILKEDKNNFLALYYKASAYKISRDYRLYELTLKEYIKLQPNNQIVLAEYYTYRHEQIPREKRRIRIKLIDENNLSYEELEQIRLEKQNSSLDSNDIKNQCSFILHLQSFDSLTTKLLEIIINISRLMIQAEENYQHEHKSIQLPFSYITYCFNLLVEVTKFPQIDLILSMMEDNYRVLLDELISFYSSRFDDIEKLNRLKKL